MHYLLGILFLKNKKSFVIEFFRKPTINIKLNDSLNLKLRESFSSIFYIILFLISYAIFIKITDYLIFINTNFSIYDKIISNQNQYFKNNPFYAIIFILIIAPFIEEIIFRLPLRVSKMNLSLSMSFMCLLFIGGNNLADLNFTFESIFLKSSSIFLVVFLIIKIDDKTLLKLTNERFYTKYFYAFSIIFGLLHIRNFYQEIPVNLLLFTPLYIIPQIILSLFLGYIRLKNGIIWSILLHSLFNFPGIIFQI